MRPCVFAKTLIPVAANLKVIQFLRLFAEGAPAPFGGGRSFYGGRFCFLVGCKAKATDGVYAKEVGKCRNFL